MKRYAKTMWLAASGCLLLGLGGGCLPDNLWATILGDTIISGVATAVRDAVLTSVGL